VAVLLNLTPDHLDWHGDFEAYVAAKLKIFRRQGPEDWAVTEAGLAGRFDAGRARRVTFGGARASAGAVTVEDGWIVHNLGGASARIMPAGGLAIRGAHNLANAMAAAAAALIWGVDEKAIAATLQTFKGVEHR